MVKSYETVTIKIYVDDGDATKTIKELDESLKSIQISGDQAGSSMRNLGNQTSDAKGSLEKTTKTFKNSTIALRLNKAAALALEAVKNSMDEAFSHLDAMENFERTLLRIYDGNQEMADQVLSATDDMVRGTAYALDSVADHMKGFIASGNRTWEQATDDIAAWGDAVAFYGDGSSDQFDKVLRNLVSMSSKGTVRMEDLTTAVSAGIPVYDIYAAATGKSVEEVQRSFTTGQVSAEEFLDVMTTSFNEGIGDFAAIEGAAKEVGGSWSNTFRNFSTAVARGTASIISDLDDAFGETRWGSIRDIISKTGKVFETVLKGVGGVVASTVIVLSRLVSALEPISPLIVGIAASIGTFMIITKATAAVMAFNQAKITATRALNLAKISQGSLTVAMKTSHATELLGHKITGTTNTLMAAKNGVITAQTLLLGVLAGKIKLNNAAMLLAESAFHKTTIAGKIFIATKQLASAAMATGQLAATALSVSYGLLTGQLDLLTVKTVLATKAQAALSAVKLLMNPVGIAVGIGALTAAIVTYSRRTNESTEETRRLKEEQEELRGSVEELSDSTRDSSVAFSENKKDIEVNRRANTELATEIQALTEVEGDSIANKALLDSKIQELNHSVEGLNLSYDEESGLLSESVEFIEARIQAQAEQEKMNVAQERLTEILREQIETEMKLEEINAKREIWNEKLKDGTVNTKEHAKAMDDLDEQSVILIDTQEDLAISYEAAAKIQQESAEAAALAVENGTLRQITSWEELESSHAGVAERMKETYKKFADVATTSDKKVFDSQQWLMGETDEYGNAIELSYEEMKEGISQSIEEILEVKEHNIKVAEEWGTNLGIISENACDSVVDEMMRMAQESPEMAYLMVEASEEQFARFEEVARGRSEAASNAMNNKLGEGYEDVIALTSDFMGTELPDTLNQLLNDAGFGDIGAQIPEELGNGVVENQEAMDSAAEELMTETQNYLEQQCGDGTFNDIGQTLPEELADGIELSAPKVEIATDIVVSMAYKSIQELEPKFHSAGRDAVLGLANGMSKNEEIAVKTASRVGSSIFTALKEIFNINSPSRLMRDQIGKPIVEGISVGIESNANLIGSSLNHLNSDMIHSAQTGSVDVVKTYGELGRDLELSLNRWPLFTRTALSAVNQVFQTQTKISNRTIFQAVAEMTRSMNQLMPNFRSAGQSAMTGLNQGLLNGRAQVMNTARSIANQVASTMQNALKINSPSRVMRDDVGKWIPYGIAEGIDLHSDKALNSTEDLGKQMIKLPNISAESILEGRFGRLGSPQSYSTPSASNNHSVTNNYSYEGLMEGATIIWKGKEDIRQTMQEIAWITQREEARM